MSSSTKKMSTKNRNPIQQWSITFPQSKEMERKEFVDMFPPHIAYKCCRETHKNGIDLHIHLGIKFIKGITFSNLRKWVERKFPDDWKRIHFQPTRDKKLWDNYCGKEDPDAIVLCEPVKKQKPSKAILRMCKEMEIIEMINDEEWKWNVAKIAELEEWHRKEDKKETARLRTYYETEKDEEIEKIIRERAQIYRALDEKNKKPE